MKEQKQPFVYISKKIIFVLYTFIIFGVGITSAIYAPKIKKYFFAPKISVIMSTYNRAKVLPHAIESILNQTYDDFEFIIINDGSTDETDGVIKSYARKDNRIVYLKNEKNKGLIYSLNLGLENARGEYIARMDDDDKSVLFRFERQVKAMEDFPDIIVLGTRIIGKDSIPHMNKGKPMIDNPDQTELNSYFSSALAHPTIFIRRKFLEKNNIRYRSDYLYAEDCGLYKDILNKGGKISAIKEGLLHFRYIQNLSHPENYSPIQVETFKKIQGEKIKQFFDVPYEMLGAFQPIQNKCEILKKMVPANKEKNILNQDLLEKMQKDVCKLAYEEEKGIKIEHPYWADTIVVEDDMTFYRIGAREETGTIQKNKDHTVTLKWNNWGPEVYRIKNDKYYVYLKDISGNIKKKPSK